MKRCASTALPRFRAGRLVILKKGSFFLSCTRRMSDFVPRTRASEHFEQDGLEEILERVLLIQPLKELAELQLVNQQWRRLISSPEFSKMILDKDAIFLVCDNAILVIPVCSLLEISSVPIYTPRRFPLIKFPIVGIIGSCDGLICLIDATQSLFVINQRNLNYRTVIRDELIFRAYGLGWQVKDSVRSHVLVVVDCPFPHIQRLRTLNLQTNQWSHLNNDSQKFGWSLPSISRNAGVFVNGTWKSE